MIKGNKPQEILNTLHRNWTEYFGSIHDTQTIIRRWIYAQRSAPQEEVKDTTVHEDAS